MTGHDRSALRRAALGCCAALAFSASCSSSSEPGADARATDGAGPRLDKPLHPDPDGARADLRLPDQRVLPDGAVAPDQGSDGPAPDQAALPTIAEQEPNDGASPTELNHVTVPTKISGAIGTAGDTDLFRFTATAGERYVIHVLSAADLQVHVAIFGEPPLDIPPVVNRGPGNDGMAELYVLKSGNHLVAVRDRRNVGSSPAGVGGATFGYTATIEPLTRPPVPAAVDGEVSGQLDPPGVVRVFSFSANPDDELTIAAIAQHLAPPSDVDTRLSLFHPGQKAWLGTNDNPSLSEIDSLLAGKMPFAGTYHAIVENVADSGSDHRFKLQIDKVATPP